MYYIANRADAETMRALLGTDRLRRLNGRATATLSKCANLLGIKQKQKGVGLTFWAVETQKELERLTDEKWALMNALTGNAQHPLITCKRDDLNKVYKEVNARYPARMSSTEHDAYQAELVQALVKICTKINEDVKVEREVKSYDNGEPWEGKVGDLIRIGWGRCATYGIVTRVSEKTVWYAEALLDGEMVISNFEYAKFRFDGVIETHRGDYGDMGFKIPYDMNRARFQPGQRITQIRRHTLSADNQTHFWEYVPSIMN